MKRTSTQIKLFFILFLCSYSLQAQKSFWIDVPEASNILKQDSKVLLPKKYRMLKLDHQGLLAALRRAPREFTDAARIDPLILSVPMPGGAFQRFTIAESPIMEPGLAANFPGIRTYGGQGVEDPSATIKLDWTEYGLHAMIFSPENGSVIIDPYWQGSPGDYLSYHKKDAPLQSTFAENEIKIDKEMIRKNLASNRTVAAECVGGTLGTYRLAIACTGQYANAIGGSGVTPAQALSAIVTTVNRVNGVYETEVDIRMVLVNNNDRIVFTNPNTQPFKGNNNASLLIEESQQVIDSLIGNANYDIGHTFSTGAGGYAIEGVVCNSSLKAKGVTGSTRPFGDAYNIDFVGHEIGHQFGASHTFNATTGNCGGTNGNISTNAEPGSGVTMMGYAGICQAVNNLQENSIPYFHARSFDQIIAYSTTGSGNTCTVKLATGNRSPIVNAGADYTIPKSTPFSLTGSATDPDSNPVTYSWEQINVGSPFGDWNKPVENAPIFRSFPPVNTPVRHFPQLSDVNTNTTTIGEVLPSYGRSLDFRLTARDNRAGGGGICSDETTITVAANAGPFVVTAPNNATTLDVGHFTTITWDVANTNIAPVNCTNVDIQLSLDSGWTFPITLISNTPNDGIEEIVIPNNITTKARVRVKSAGNVFFDISNVNFTIRSTSELGFAFSNPLPVAACSNVASTVINTNALNKFSTPITLSASGNPAGTTVVFSSNPINPGANASVTLTGDIPNGIFNITITGTAGSVIKTRVVQYTVGTPTQVPVNFAPANNSTGALLMPRFNWVGTSDAQLYNLQISTSPAFTTNVQSIDSITGSTYTLTKPLEANTEYYWRVVTQNVCGAGPASTKTLFKTFAIVCEPAANSSNVPLVIDADNKDTIVSDLSIAGGSRIQDIDVVGLRGTHTYVSDINVSLTSPSGRRILLFKDQCGSNEHFNLNLDDEATTAIICPINNAQTSRPAQLLSAFDNEISTGTWKLQLIDAQEEDGGSLTNWGLRICYYSETALPVSWLEFSAHKNEHEAVVLQWTTANELNNDYYEVEKSIDGISFDHIGKIAAGNTAGVQQYLYNDLKPFAGVGYYRLKQVDKDGNYTYSKVAKVSVDKIAGSYVVYPNPAIDKSTVRILQEFKQLSISLTDASGRLVYKKIAGPAKVGEQFEVPVKGLGKGMYIFSLTSEKGISIKKIMIQ